MTVYFELSWAILSTIGIANVIYSLTVASICGFPPISLVPLVVSAACAVANGLCYYVFYTDYPVVNKAAASGFTDFLWLIQEAGLSFYSYIILKHVLENRRWIVFCILFWFFIAAVTSLRLGILVIRIQYILGGSQSSGLIETVGDLHICYFVCIASLELLNAFFLLQQFHQARQFAVKTGHVSYLLRSTEIRLSLLALIGIMRAVTYSFQATAQSATTVASQLDRFAYTLESMFPIMMLIDMLASRLIFATSTRSEAFNMMERNIQERPQSVHCFGRTSTYSTFHTEFGSNERGEAVIHRKCDEKRPVYGPCAFRQLECRFEVTLKWTDHASLGSFDTHARRKKRRGSRRSGEAPISSSPTAQRDSRPTLPPSRPHALPPEQSSSASPVNQSHSHGGHFSSSGERLSIAKRATASGAIESPIASASGQSCTISPNDKYQWHGIDAILDASNLDSWMTNDITRVTGHGIKSSTDLSDASPTFSRESSSWEESSEDEGGSSSWIMNNTLSDFLFQMFQNRGEEIAFMYFFKRVCSCIPAHDSDTNPWRKLSLISLSYPVLLHGILAVSTAHMNNYGRSSERLLSSRQSRALASLQTALALIQEEKDRGHVTSIAGESTGPSNIFSVLSMKEVALAAVMMQTPSVLMTGIGSVEVHMRCAWHFILDLGCFSHPPASFFSRLIVQRFAMVDVVLAHLRFRRPLAPLNFFMYQAGSGTSDDEEPSFREMHGCSRRVLSFLAQISVLGADLTTTGSSQAQIQAQSFRLETEMRTWGAKYFDSMSSEDNGYHGPARSALNMASICVSGSSHHEPTPLENLDVLDECFFWVAHILLMRRVLGDRTQSTRVQLVRRHLFQLMDKLKPGCGADSSLPFPFYMAAREAMTLEDRDWVRQRHEAMMEAYRDRSREYLMASTERIWERLATADTSHSGTTPFWETSHERFIREMDTQASYFMF
nr:sterol uptake control protein 2 [Verruciconidia persicina]